MKIPNFTYDFVYESNLIEGINREPSPAEMFEFDRFMALEKITVAELERFVKVYEPDAKLRDQPGMDVDVGTGQRPPHGGPEIRERLEFLLKYADKYQMQSGLVRDVISATAFWNHLKYEHLHPFTDCNGRSGRMLWCWQYQPQKRKRLLTFLQEFYYQTISQCSTIPSL